ncbi:hypothetical protein [Flavobacterium salmonis]|uniref:Uncharacterized protein n=1 Tax=Flavobacterium salmonis TaxID=2654844 RepID=A0A6V6Z259_9FLAO|nr:hypothetical protein [Flavobacterium salmonis]CAD0005766.1 hypothetical protein FLAT13_02935 [Flavobacterium salmonis]
MKRILPTLFLLFCFEFSNSQMVLFTKKYYVTGEPVKAVVTGDLLGIENGIKKSSYSSVPGSIELGSASNAGFYRVDFKFNNNISKNYLIAILSGNQTALEDYVIELPSNTINIPNNIVTNIFRYFKNENEKLLEVTNKAVKKFGAENAVGVILNASFCITTISGQPSVFAICKSLSSSNLKKLGLIMMQTYLEDMKFKNYISEKEYNTIYGALALSQIGAVLSSNCSILFKSLKVLAEDPNLKVAIGYFEQQCKTTVVIIEKAAIH